MKKCVFYYEICDIVKNNNKTKYKNKNNIPTVSIN